MHILIERRTTFSLNGFIIARHYMFRVSLHSSVAGMEICKLSLTDFRKRNFAYFTLADEMINKLKNENLIQVPVYVYVMYTYNILYEVHVPKVLAHLI